MSTEARAPSRAPLGSLMRTPLFAIIAGAVTLLLIVTAVVVYVVRFDPFDTNSVSPDRAPSAFPTSLSLTGSPVGARGSTVTMELMVSAPEKVTRVELWDGSALYYSDAAPAQTIDKSGVVHVSLDLEYVPLLAGQHWLSARTFTASKASVSDPVDLPVRDRAPNATVSAGVLVAGAVSTGPAMPVSVHSNPGDTAGDLARRLDLQTSDLAVPALDGVAITGSTPLPAGTLVIGRLVAAAVAAAAGAPSPASNAPHLITAVEDCKTVVVIVGAKTNDDWALYATSPVRPGFQRIGDVGDDARFTTTAAPIGDTTYVAYPLGTLASNAGIDHEPTAPAVADVPDSCASSGWSGHAKIVNGVLMTDSAIVNPYAYVSVDQGAWVRVPAQQGAFLTTGELNDVRSAVPQSKFDQIDVQVWSYQNGFAAQVSDGLFCRKSMPNADPGDSSASGGKCQPSGVVAKDSKLRTATAISLTVATPAQKEIDIPSGDPPPKPLYGDDPSIQASYSMRSDQPVKLTGDLNGNDADELELQLSYYPIGEDSDSPSPPGVFAQIWMKQTSQGGMSDLVANSTLHPWKWKDGKVNLADPFAEIENDNPLSLDDEIAIAIANQRIKAGKDLLETLYIRAVALSGLQPIPTGVVSPTIEIDMSGALDDPKLPDPLVQIIPGVQLSIGQTSEPVYPSDCFTISKYPDATSAAGAEAQAKGEFPDPGGTYCLAQDATFEQEQDAMAADDAGCGLACFFTALVIGIAVGVFTAGVGGALVGAAIAAGLTLVSGTIVAGLEKEIAELWDSIAAAYNTVYHGILTLAADLNPLCIAVKGMAGKNSTAAQTCDAVTEAVTSAVITSVTGLPPSLPMSSEVEAIAAGNVGALASALTEAALQEVGLDCSDFTLPADDSKAITTIGANVGGEAGKTIAAAIDSQTGGISGCSAIGNLVDTAAQTSIEGSYSDIFSSVYGAQLPPGLLVTSVATSVPQVLVAAVAPHVPTGQQETTCPITMNLTANLPWITNGEPGHHAFKYWPITSTLKFTPAVTKKVVGADQKVSTVITTPAEWTAAIPIPLFSTAQAVATDVAENPGSAAIVGNASGYMFEYTLDSPCFASTYAQTLSQFGSDGNQAAFIAESPTVYAYH